MTQQQENKRKLADYMAKHNMHYRLSISKHAPDVVTIHGWPSMQGQGVEAAGYMALRLSKIVKFAQSHGFEARRFGVNW